MRQGQTAWRAIGQGNIQPYFLALLAEAYGQTGQAEEGLSALAEALAVLEKTDERFYEAELYRLKAMLTLRAAGRMRQAAVPNPQSPIADIRAEGEAEACLLNAIEMARRQSAKSLELRAVTSLSRLLQEQGKKDEARQMLAEIYGWFTEGFDTADLKDAKALLEELSN